MKDASELIGTFSDKIISIATTILKQGFGLILVGGCVRDFFKDGKTGKDLDFELTYKEKLEGRDWELKIDHLIQVIKEHFSYEVEKLPFLIVKITGPDFFMELAPPRMEVYKDKDRYGHSDFTCQILSQMDCKKSFLRRDITINSIGIKWQLNNPLITIVKDPFNGLSDLKHEIIRTVNPDFYKDPVRFLRIVRFSLNFDMKFDRKLTKNLPSFNLSLLTHHHFFKEAFKCNFFLFIEKFFILTEKHGIVLPMSLKDLSFLKASSLHRYNPENKKEVLAILFFNETRNFNKNDLVKFVKYSGLKKNYLKYLSRCQSVLDDLMTLSPEKLKENIQNLPVKEVLEDDILETVLGFFSLIKQDLINDDILKKSLSQKKMKTWKKWRSILPKDLTGENLFIELDRTVKIKSKYKSHLRVYAHLKKIWGQKQIK